MRTATPFTAICKSIRKEELALLNAEIFYEWKVLLYLFGIDGTNFDKDCEPAMF